MGQPVFFALGAIAFFAILLFLWWREEEPLVDKARAMIQKGAYLVDVDEPDEFARSHVEGAVNIPLQDIARRANEIGTFEHPVVVCGRGKLRAARATHELRAIGFQDVLNVGRAHW